MARPKRKFTEAEERLIAEYALAGCQDKTIATLIEVEVRTLKAHYSTLLHKKRAERKYELRMAQNRLAKTNPAMAIFLGKNELGQSNENEFTGTITLAQAFLEADNEDGSKD